ILGNMFAGKTEELIKRLRRMEEYEHKNVLVFKPKTDTRSGNNLLKTAKGDTFPASDIESMFDVFDELKNEKFNSGKTIDVIAFDEIQFFSSDTYGTIDHLLSLGYDIIVAGLKLNFKGEPFINSISLLGLVKSNHDLLLLTSCCSICGDEAQLPQRIINGEPAKYTDPVKLIGGNDFYQPRCHKHFILREKPPFA
ncbi:MAG: thymidine kinase, partial [Candidatus Paceibacterota bacterium]